MTTDFHRELKSKYIDHIRQSECNKDGLLCTQRRPDYRAHGQAKTRSMAKVTGKLAKKGLGKVANIFIGAGEDVENVGKSIGNVLSNVGTEIFGGGTESPAEWDRRLISDMAKYPFDHMPEKYRRMREEAGGINWAPGTTIDTLWKLAHPGWQVPIQKRLDREAQRQYAVITQEKDQEAEVYAAMRKRALAAKRRRDYEFGKKRLREERYKMRQQSEAAIKELYNDLEGITATNQQS